MIRLSAEIKQGILQSLYRAAQNNGPTPLWDALGTWQDSLFAGVKGGRLVSNHTGAGKAVAFIVPQIGSQFRQEEVFAFSQELINIYGDALTTLGITKPTDASQDANIFNTMMADDRLQDVDSTSNDFTLAGWPYR